MLAGSQRLILLTLHRHWRIIQVGVVSHAAFLCVAVSSQHQRRHQYQRCHNQACHHDLVHHTAGRTMGAFHDVRDIRTLAEAFPVHPPVRCAIYLWVATVTQGQLSSAEGVGIRGKRSLTSSTVNKLRGQQPCPERFPTKLTFLSSKLTFLSSKPTFLSSKPTFLSSKPTFLRSPAPGSWC